MVSNIMHTNFGLSSIHIKKGKNRGSPTVSLIVGKGSVASKFENKLDLRNRATKLLQKEWNL